MRFRGRMEAYASEITIIVGSGSLRSGPIRPFSGEYLVARPLNPKLVSFWRDRIGRLAVSGLTIVQFCNKERCARSAFQRWKRHFQRMDVLDQPPTSSIPSPRPNPPAPPTFLPVAVRIIGNHTDQPSPPIEADLPNGIRLRIPTADVLLACRIIRVVAGAKTDAGVHAG